MIAKIVKHGNFKQTLKYVLEKEGSQLIGGNMAHENVSSLVDEFSWFLHLNERVKKPLCHISLSVSNSEHLEDSTWNAIAREFLEGLELDHNQYIVVRHSDREHDHIHIVANRIRWDGKCVSDWWDFRRGEQIVRELEAKYQLYSGTAKNLAKTSPKVGEVRIARSENKPSVRTVLQDAIDEIAPQVVSISELAAKLGERNIETRFRDNDAGEVAGICFSLQVEGKEKPVAFKGSQLGRIYSYPGLQKHFQLSPVSILSAPEAETQLELDEEDRVKNIAETSTEKESQPEFSNTTQDSRTSTQEDGGYETEEQGSWETTEAENQKTTSNSEAQSQYTDDQKIQFTGNIADQVLSVLDKREFVGERYTAQWRNQELTVIRNENGQEMLRAKYDHENQRWVAQSQHQISDADVEQLRRLRLELMKVMEAQEKPRKALALKKQMERQKQKDNQLEL